MTGQPAASADRGGARARRARGPRAGARRGLLARHAPAAAHRARDPARPARSSSSTSRRSASTRSARASCARRSPGSSQAGKTVLLTTHYMFEADTLCDRVAVIARGRIVARGDAARAEGARRRPHGASRSRCSGSTSATVRRLRGLAGRDLGLGRGARAGAGADDPVAARARADAGAAGLPRRRADRPDRRPRADARGRLRRARHGGQPNRAPTPRIVWIGARLARARVHGLALVHADGRPPAGDLRLDRLLHVPGRRAGPGRCSTRRSAPG